MFEFFILTGLYIQSESLRKELWLTVHNSTKLQTRSKKDAILHKEWDKLNDLYRQVQQGHILGMLNIQLKGSCRTDRWKGKGQRDTGLEI